MCAPSSPHQEGKPVEALDTQIYWSSLQPQEGLCEHNFLCFLEEETKAPDGHTTRPRSQPGNRRG